MQCALCTLIIARSTLHCKSVNTHCTINNEYCALCTVLNWVLCIEQGPLYTEEHCALCTMLITRCTFFSAHTALITTKCRLQTACFTHCMCTVYNAVYILQNAHCRLNTAQCTLHTVVLCCKEYICGRREVGFLLLENQFSA